MRVVITRPVALDVHGGGTIHSLGLARALMELGVDVWFITVSSGKSSIKRWPSDRLIEVEPFGVKGFLDCIPVARAVMKLNNEFPIDFVLGWQYEAALLPMLAKKNNFVLGFIAGFPFTAWAHRKTNFRWLKQFVDELFRYYPMRKSAVIFSPSDFSRRELVDVVGVENKKIKIVPCGVDQEFFAVNVMPNDAQKFIFSGSLEPLKGVFDLILALKEIKRRGFVSWSLRVVAWDNPKRLIEFSKAHGLDGMIEFTGALSREELAAILADSSMAILPSHTETFGLAIAEAQAAGLPVISYNTGAIPEIVEHGVTGILVELYNINALADAIIELANDPIRSGAMGQSGRRKMKALFSWSDSARRTLRILEDLR